MDRAKSVKARAGGADEGNPLLRTLALALAVFAVLSFASRWLGGRSRLVGRDAPNFELAVAANGGGRVSLGMRDLHGQVVLLDFWATWCGPCRMEAPIVERVSRAWRDRGVSVVGVNMDTTDQGDPSAFAAAYGLTYPIVRDLAGEASRRYGVDTLPTLVVVSRSGQVVAVESALQNEEAIEALLRRALAL